MSWAHQARSKPLLSDAQIPENCLLPGSATSATSARTLCRLGAVEFTNRFLRWTAEQGLRGPTDERRVVNLAIEFAQLEKLISPTSSQLRKSLRSLGVRPLRRPLQPYEREADARRGRSAGRRRTPTTTYYVLPARLRSPRCLEQSVKKAPPQMDLFDDFDEDVAF